MVGSKFGDYEVVRLIGRGGMGAVYEAFNATLNRRVALKVLHREYAEQEEVVRRFFNEARAVNAVNHPGVVRVSDVGRSPDDGLYLVMEYLEGETLADRLRGRGGKLPESDVITISWQLAGVLAAAHARSIVHRDLFAPSRSSAAMIQKLVAATGTRWIASEGYSLSGAVDFSERPPRKG